MPKRSRASRATKGIEREVIEKASIILSNNPDYKQSSKIKHSSVIEKIGTELRHLPTTDNRNIRLLLPANWPKNILDNVSIKDSYGLKPLYNYTEFKEKVLYYTGKKLKNILSIDNNFDLFIDDLFIAKYNELYNISDYRYTSDGLMEYWLNDEKKNSRSILSKFRNVCTLISGGRINLITEEMYNKGCFTGFVNTKTSKMSSNQRKFLDTCLVQWKLVYDLPSNDNTRKFFLQEKCFGNELDRKYNNLVQLKITN